MIIYKKLKSYLIEKTDVLKGAEIIIVPKKTKEEDLKTLFNILENIGYDISFSFGKSIIDYNNLFDVGIRVNSKPYINYDSVKFYEIEYPKSKRVNINEIVSKIKNKNVIDIDWDMVENVKDLKKVVVNSYNELKSVYDVWSKISKNKKWTDRDFINIEEYDRYPIRLILDAPPWVMAVDCYRCRKETTDMSYDRFMHKYSKPTSKNYVDIDWNII